MLADVNGDAKPDDLVVQSNCGAYTGSGCIDNNISLLLGNADGTFRNSVSPPTGVVDYSLWQM